MKLRDDSIVMAFDFGTTKIGIAVGQTITDTATPLDNVKAKDGMPVWFQLDAIVKEWKPDLLVIGIPLNMDGSKSEMSRRAKKFANRLQGRYKLPIETVDERLSSFEARELQKDLRDIGSSKGSKESIDSLAAGLILEAWFRSHTSSL